MSFMSKFLKNCFLFLVLLPSILFSATDTWTGATDSNMNTGTNWQDGTVPAGGEDLSFPSSAQRFSVVDNIAALTIGNITIDSPSNNYTITPSGGSSFSTAAAKNFTVADASGMHSMSVNVSLGGNWTLSNSSSQAVTLGGNITANANSIILPTTNVGIIKLTGSNLFTNALGDIVSIFGGTLNVNSTALGNAVANSPNNINLGSATGTTPTLQAGANSFTLVSPITLGGVGTFDSNGNTFTLSGVISDGGNAFGITKVGTGTLILSGVNTFTGIPTITAGTLSISAQNNLGAGSSVKINNATLQITSAITVSRPISLNGVGTIDTNGNNVTLSGVISDDSLSVGALTKSSTGTLTLSGTNTYSGGTTINQGTVSVTADNQLGNASGPITFAPSAANTATLALGGGAITSARALTLNGAGTNAVSTTTAWTFSGLVSGTGALTKQGASTLILTGTNTYTGGNVISAGTLQGDSNSIQGNSSITGTLNFNQNSADGTYAGVLSGAGAFTKSGSKKLTLSADSSAGYTGAITVSAGELNVTGNVSGAASLTVGSGATLSGSGTVGTTTIGAGGTINPGNSIGTLTIDGNLTLNATSTTVIEIAANSSSDFINITGTAALDGILQVTPTSSFFNLTETYTVLTAAGGLGGTTFPTVTSTVPTLVPTASYSATTVTLTVQNIAPFANFPFSNSNIRSVGQNLDVLTGLGQLNSTLQSVINLFPGQSNATINNALDHLHPAQYGSMIELQNLVGTQIASFFHRRPEARCGSGCPITSRFWVEPFVNNLALKSRGKDVGFDATAGGVALGYDSEIAENWTVGIGGAWKQASLDWERGRGDATVNGYYGSLYTDYTIKNVYLGASLLAGADDFDVSRKIKFLSVDVTANGDYTAAAFVGELTAAAYFGPTMCFAAPYLNLDFIFLRQYDFTEKNAQGLNLSVGQTDSSTLRTEIGIALQVQDTNYEETFCISPLVSLSYVNMTPLVREKYKATFAGATVPFYVEGWDSTWNLISVKFGLKMGIYGFSAAALYNAETSFQKGTPLFDQQGSILLSWSW